MRGFAEFQVGGVRRQQHGSMIGVGDTLNQIVDFVLSEYGGPLLGSFAEPDHRDRPVTRDGDAVEETSSAQTAWLNWLQEDSLTWIIQS